MYRRRFPYFFTPHVSYRFFPVSVCALHFHSKERSFALDDIMGPGQQSTLSDVHPN